MGPMGHVPGTPGLNHPPPQQNHISLDNVFLSKWSSFWRSPKEEAARHILLKPSCFAKVPDGTCCSRERSFSNLAMLHSTKMIFARQCDIPTQSLSVICLLNIEGELWRNLQLIQDFAEIANAPCERQLMICGMSEMSDDKTIKNYVFFFRGPIRSDEQPPVPHIASIQLYSASFTSSNPPSLIVWPKKESLLRTIIPRNCLVVLSYVYLE